MRLLFVIGTRPEAIKLAPVIRKAIDRGCMVKLLFTRQQDQMKLKAILNDFNIVAPCCVCKSLMEDSHELEHVLSQLIRNIGDILSTLPKETIVVVQGDTASAMAGALAAHLQKRPVAHVEAGLRSGDIFAPFPEEMYRTLIDNIADPDLRFVPTIETASKNLIDGRVVGNTIVDAFKYIRDNNGNAHSIGKLCPHKYVIITAHRRENFEAIGELVEAVNQLASNYKDVIFYWMQHSNPKASKYLTKLSGDNIHVTEPERYAEFVHTICNASLIISDSGGIQEEIAETNTPLLITRRTTERPEALYLPGVNLIPMERNAIIWLATRYLNGTQVFENRINPFGDGHASTRIVNILENFAEKRRLFS